MPRILKESALIEEYRMMLVNTEENFFLKNYTTHHTAPNLEKTIARLLDHMKRCQQHEYVSGRDSDYCIVDALREGIGLIKTDFEKRQIIDIAAEGNDGDDEVELDDLDA